MIGLHRPYFGGEEFGSLEFSVADKKYKELLSRMKSYLSGMPFPEVWTERMLDTSSSDLTWATGDDVFAAYKAPASIQEWLTSACGSDPAPRMTKLKAKYSSAPFALPDFSKWSMADKDEFDKLGAANVARGECENVRLDRHRLSGPP